MIYIVTEGEYSDFHIEACFSTRENAEQYIMNHTDPMDGGLDDRLRLSDYKIHEYELDVLLNEVEEYVTRYRVTLDLKSGNVTANYMNNPHSEWRCLAEKSYRGQYMLRTSGNGVTFSGIVEGISQISKEHAMKLAVEGRQFWLREKITGSYMHREMEEEKK